MTDMQEWRAWADREHAISMNTKPPRKRSEGQKRRQRARDARKRTAAEATRQQQVMEARR